MLASDNEIAEYWEHNNTPVGPVPTNVHTGTVCWQSGALGKVRPKHGTQYRSNPYMRKHK